MWGEKKCNILFNLVSRYLLLIVLSKFVVSEKYEELKRNLTVIATGFKFMSSYNMLTGLRFVR